MELHLCCVYYCLLVTALTVTFGSLYQDEVEITCKNVVGILAAATLFSLVCIYSLTDNNVNS